MSEEGREELIYCFMKCLQAALDDERTRPTKVVVGYALKKLIGDDFLLGVPIHADSALNPYEFQIYRALNG